MPLDVRLKHLIGLVGEILPKPLIYVIPVVGMINPMKAVVIYRCTSRSPRAAARRRTLPGTSAGCMRRSGSLETKREQGTTSPGNSSHRQGRERSADALRSHPQASPPTG